MTDVAEAQPNETLEARARRLVQQEVQQCLSSLVDTLARSYGEARGDLGDLVEQAFELARPVPDYESAAEEAGWTKAGPDNWTMPCDDDSDIDPEFNTAEDCCEFSNVEPHDREVFEFWSVSGWLGDRLKEHGEKVDDDFAGMVVWARTTTNQAIYADGVIERIAADLMKSQPAAEERTNVSEYALKLEGMQQ